MSHAVLTRWWTWVVPLVGAALVFVAVMLTTPPGFGAITEVVLATPRGTTADSAAYVLGSASSLALLTLLVLTAAAIGIAAANRLRNRD